MKSFIVFVAVDDPYFDTDNNVHCIKEDNLKTFCTNLEEEGVEYCIYELGKRLGTYHARLTSNVIEKQEDDDES